MSNWHYQHIPVESEVEFIDRSSAELEQAIADAIEQKGQCILGLSGGSTPRPIYEALGQLVAVEWDKVTIFLVDDRYVPADHDESNQKLVRETLLRNAPISEHQIIFPDTSLSLDECIEDYDFRVGQLVGPLDTRLLGSEEPRYGATPTFAKATVGRRGDIIVTLGLGEDGHIASLFPGDADALLEKEEHVIHTQTDTFAVRDRITVTLPVLRNAGRQFFFLKGEGKKKIFTDLISANEDPIEYPAHALLQADKSIWVTWW